MRTEFLTRCKLWTLVGRASVPAWPGTEARHSSTPGRTCGVGAGPRACPPQGNHTGLPLQGVREKTLRLMTIAFAMGCLAWLDPVRDRINEGNRLFQEGKFGEAIRAYGEVLVDNPSDPLLNFNMGAAHYKAGKYPEALSSFSRIPETPEGAERAAQAAYNAGNAQYQIGAAAETSQPKEALDAYEAALASYRRALGTNPSDQDAKFNYEFVAKKIEDLKERMKQQQQDGQGQQNQQQNQQDQQQQNSGQNQQDQAGQQKQQGQQDQQNQQGQQDQQKQQGQQDQQDSPEPNQDQQSAETDQQQDKQAEQAEQDSQAKQDEQNKGDERQSNPTPGHGESSDMSEEEASALIDTAKKEELRPGEFIRQAQGAVVAEPQEDW